jgi:hypothetical protein
MKPQYLTASNRDNCKIMWSHIFTYIKIPLPKSILRLLIKLMITAAWASPVFAYSQGITAVIAGDVARYQQDHEAALEHYREAISSGEPAAEAMARLRLLSVSGNLGGVIHGPSIDRALAQCEGAWCELAHADYHLFAPPEVGASPSIAVEYAQSALAELPSPSAARLFLATGDEQWLALLDGADDLDGLGQSLVGGAGQLPALPPTWYLGLGLFGAPSVGLGGSALFVHPSYRMGQFGVGASASSAGQYSLSSWYRRRVGVGIYSASVRVFDGTRDLYLGDIELVYDYGEVELSLGAGGSTGLADVEIIGNYRKLRNELELVNLSNLELRILRNRRRGAGVLTRGHLLELSVAMAPFGETSYLFGHLDYRRWVASPFGGGLAFRALWMEGVGSDHNLYLMPSAGGSRVHRGAVRDRWISPRIATTDVEQRWTLFGPVELVTFANLLYAKEFGLFFEQGRSDLHYGAGVGFRIIQTPKSLNVVRLDFAISDTDRAIYAGWGEAF